MEFPLFLKQLRRMRKMTQKDLAEATGLSIGSIQGYEQGKYLPKAEQIRKLSKALNVSFHELDPLFPDEEGMYYADEITTPPTRDSDLKEDLLNNYEKLNIDGKLRVNEHVELLLKVPEYRKEE